MSLEAVAKMGDDKYVGIDKLLPQVFVSGENAYRLANQTLSTITDEGQAVYQATVAPSPNILTAGGEFYIDIPRASRDVLKNITVRYDITETGGTNPVTLKPAPLFCSRIEVLGNNGSVLLQTIYGHSLFFDTIVTAEPTLKSYANNGNYAYPTLNTPTAITASSSVTYYVPLINAFCEQFLDFVPGNMNGYVRLRFVMQSTAVASGTGVPSLINAYLYCHFTKLMQSDREGMAKRYKLKLHRPILDNISMPTTQPFNASSTYTIPLNSVTGEIAYSTSVFIPANASGANTYAWIAIPATTTINMLDSEGKSFADGAGPYPYQFLQGIHAPKHTVNLVATNVPIILWIHGDPVDANRGIKNGLLYYDGKCQFQISLPSSWSSGTYTLLQNFKKWRHIDVVDQNFTISDN